MSVKPKTKPKAKAASKTVAPKAASKGKAKAASSRTKTVRSKPAEKPAAAPKKRAPKKSGGGNDDLRSMLTQLRRETLLDLREKMRSGSEGGAKDIGDMYDHASEDRDRELDLLLSDRERGKLKQIENAFQRLEEGTYGECEECGDPINKKRLHIVPFARTCVDCQQEKENEDRLQSRDPETAAVYSGAATEAPVSTDDDI